MNKLTVCPRCGSDDPETRLEIEFYPIETQAGPVPYHQVCENDAFHDTPAFVPASEPSEPEYVEAAERFSEIPPQPDPPASAFHDTPASEPRPDLGGELSSDATPYHTEPTPSKDKEIDICNDCRRPYGDEYGFPDLVLPNNIWDQISPTKDSHGLLCPSCIVKRCQRLGLKCEAKWFSGPFVDETGGWFTLEHCDARVAEALKQQYEGKLTEMEAKQDAIFEQMRQDQHAEAVREERERMKPIDRQAFARLADLREECVKQAHRDQVEADCTVLETLREDLFNQARNHPQHSAARNRLLCNAVALDRGITTLRIINNEAERFGEVYE